jgi:hypothetical protein
MEIRWDARAARPAANSTTQVLQNMSRRRKVCNVKSTLNLLNAEKCFRYLRTYKVLVCLQHKTGIQNLNSHLRDYLTDKQRRA